MASQTIKGITIKLGADASELTTALDKAEKSLKTTKDSLKQVDKALKFNPGNADLLKQKMHLLNTEVDETKNSIKQMESALKMMDDKGVDKTSKEYMDLQRNIITAKSKLKELENAQRRFNIEGSKVGQVAAKMKQCGDKAKEAANKLRGVSAAATVGLGAAVAVTSEFDSAMSQVRAVSGATGKDFDSLRNKAREMGAKTKFSATESAEAMNYMAMAGWKTEDMLDGIEGIMNLAAASGEDLATTSDIVTDGLTAMGYSAKDSGRLADVMAAASSNANTNVSMMGQTFKYAASVAGTLGYSMEDVALATGLMANSGIKADQAGTSLRQVFSRLASPTDKIAGQLERLGIETTNADGSMKPFREVLVSMRSAFSELSSSEQAQAAKTIAGTNAMSGFLALINGSDKDFDKLATAIDNSSGAAEGMANTMIDNLGGQVTILKSALQELAIGIGDTLVPAVKVVTTAVQNVVNWFNNLTTSQKQLIATIGVLTAALAPILAVFGALTAGISAGVSAIAGMFATIMRFMPAITSLGKVVLPMITTAFSAMFNVLRANPVGAVLTIIGVLTALQAKGISVSDAITKFVNNVISKINKVANVAPKIITQFVSKLTANLPKIIESGVKLITALVNGVVKSIPTLVKSAPKIVSALAKGVVALAKALVNAGVTLIKALLSGITGMLGTFKSKVKGWVSSAKSAFTFSGMGSFGTNLVKGIWEGISGGLGWIKSKITGWVGNVKNFLKNLFGIHSPSTWARDIIGENLVKGMANGITGNTRLVSDAMGSLMNATKPTMASMSNEMANAVGTGLALQSQPMSGGTYHFTVEMAGTRVAEKVFKLSQEGKLITEG